MNMEKSARWAAKRYLEIVGYTILDENFDDTGFIIAEDDEGVIAFVDVDYSTEIAHDIIPNISRDAFERMIFKYFKQSDTPTNKSIRYDTIDVVILREDRAIIKHRVNDEIRDE